MTTGLTGAITRFFGCFARARRGWISDRAGNVAVFFSLSLLPLVAVAGAGFDFMSMSALRSELQAAADAGALRAARELRLARTSTIDVTALAQSAAQPVLMNSAQGGSNSVVRAALIENASAVQVDVSAVYTPRVMRVVYREPIPVAARAVARSSGFPVCAVAFESTGADALLLQDTARVTAQFCAVQSNSRHPHGLTANGGSLLTAGMICTVGGKVGSGANFLPDPLTDCPAVADPLAARAPPKADSCGGGGGSTTGASNDHLASTAVLTNGTYTLTPQTFCGGLILDDGAIVTLAPGEYVIKDGPLIVNDGATLQSSGASIYLAGAHATFSFSAESTIRLTAPKSGPLAGILFYEDRAAPELQTHEILSNNASQLLGTVYLPRGRLVVNTKRPIAQSSAFTIILARRMEMYGGSNLVLNSDYASTSVPVPGGLNRSSAILVK